MAQGTRKLAQNVFLNGEFYAAGSTPSKDIADQIDNPKAWGVDEADEADGAKSYDDQRVGALKTEAEKRGLTVEGADGKAAVKADYVAALEAHDAASTGA